MVHSDCLCRLLSNHIAPFEGLFKALAHSNKDGRPVLPPDILEPLFSLQNRGFGTVDLINIAVEFHIKGKEKKDQRETKPNTDNGII